MASSYTLIASANADSSSVSAFTFNSIPSTYTDLKIVWSYKTANSGWQGSSLKFNNSSAGYYVDTYLQGTGSGAAGSGVNANGTTSIYVGAIPGQSQTSTFAVGEIYIPNYTAATNKSAYVFCQTSYNTSLQFSGIISGQWAQTSAITRIDLSTNGVDNLGQYSRAYLYGISKS